MRRPSEIENLIEPLFAGTDCELVGVTVSTGRSSGASGGPQSTVKIFIDKPGGVTIDDIVSVSRKMSAYLDVEGPLSGKYTLEVSSPGLDRVLFRPEHFVQQVGNKIQISLSYPQDNQKNFKGIVQKVEDDTVYLLLENKDKKQKIEKVEKFSFEQIDKARVIPNLTVGMIGKDKKRGSEKE